jgi:DNA-binding beta-propeller fold protein YncE
VVVGTLPTVRQPNTVAVDSATGRIFVAGRTDGTVQLIDPPPRQVVISRWCTSRAISAWTANHFRRRMSS